MSACSPCCVCVGGVNYTISCKCNPCGGNSAAMSTTNPSPAINQSVGGGDGGASSLSCVLNSIGKWGSAITAQVQGKPVAVSSTGVTIGSKASAANPFAGGSGTTMILIVVVAVVLIFIATRKG